MVSLGRQHGASSLTDIEYPWTFPAVTLRWRPFWITQGALSLLARGATLQYYRMLVEKRATLIPASRMHSSPGGKRPRPDLASWELAGLFQANEEMAGGEGPKDHEFIDLVDSANPRCQGRAGALTSERPD